MFVNTARIWKQRRTRDVRAQYFIQVFKGIFKKNRLSCNLLLDIGSAGGELTRHFIHYFGPSEVVCVDIKVDRLMTAKETLDSVTLYLVQADAQYLPIRDEAIDLVTAFSVIGFMAHQERFIEEVYQALRDRGLFLLQFPNRYSVVEPHTGIVFSFLLFKSTKDAIVRKQFGWPRHYINEPSARYVESRLYHRHMIVEKKKLVFPDEAIPLRLRSLYKGIKNLLRVVSPWGYLFVAQKTSKNVE